jgi:uncharacterized protein
MLKLIPRIIDKLFIYIILFLFVFSNYRTLSSQPLIMVTGDKSGNYHKGGETLKGLAEKLGISIELRNTDGAFQNLFEVGKNEANLGLVQIDVIAGLSSNNKETKKLVNNCYAIAPTDLEYVHIVVNNASKIKKFADLKKSKVSLGSDSSGTAFTAGFLLAYLLNGVDLTAPNFINMDEEESLRKVVNGEIDAAFLTTTLNSKLLTQLGEEKTPIRLLAINTKEIPVKIKEMYHTEIIPQNTYPWQKEAVEVPATATFLLVSKQTDPKDVKKIIEIIYDNEEELDNDSHLWSSKASKAFEALKKIGIPFHPLVENHLKSKKSTTK